MRASIKGDMLARSDLAITCGENCGRRICEEVRFLGERVCIYRDARERVPSEIRALFSVLALEVSLQILLKTQREIKIHLDRSCGYGSSQREQSEWLVNSTSPALMCFF